MANQSGDSAMIVAPWSKLFQQEHSEGLVFFHEGRIQQINNQAGVLLECESTQLHGASLQSLFVFGPDCSLDKLLQRAESHGMLVNLSVSNGVSKQAYCRVHYLMLHEQRLGCLHLFDADVLPESSECVPDSASIIQDFIDRSDARANRIFNNSHHCFFDWNITDQLFEWNECGWQLLGYSSEQSHQLKPSFALIYQHVHPQDQARFLETIERHQKKLIPVHLEFRLLDVAQQNKFISLHADFHEYRGKVYISGSLEDVSSYRSAVKQINEFNRQTQNIVETLNLIVWQWDVGHTTVTISNSFWSCIGQQGQKGMQELPVNELLFYIEPADKECVSSLFTDELLGDNSEYEFKIKHAEGHYLWWKCSFTEFMTTEGALKNRSGYFIDISKEKMVQATMAHAQQMAEQANKAKSDFLSQMSHELRTPLNAILGFSQILCMDDEDIGETQRNYILEIEKAGKHLLMLIDEILDLSKIEAGHIRMLPDYFSLTPLIKECESTVQASLAKYQVQLHIDYYSIPDACIYADKTRTKQILINLLTNAIKYNHVGGNVWLIVRLSQQHTMNIMVKDDGQGIPQDKQAELFQPFNRLGRDFSEIEGTGIGLMLTKKLVELMNGSLHLSSKEGKGSAFWFDLPLQEYVEAREKSEQAMQQQASSVVEVVLCKILYVEDSYTNYQLIEHMIGLHLKANIIHARTAEQAINIAKQTPPDLVLMNVNLPGMNGFQALSSFRMNPLTAHLPIVLMTNNLMSVMQHASEFTFDGVLKKPIEQHKLVNVLDKFLKH